MNKQIENCESDMQAINSCFDSILMSKCIFQFNCEEEKYDFELHQPELISKRYKENSIGIRKILYSNASDPNNLSLNDDKVSRNVNDRHYGLQSMQSKIKDCSNQNLETSFSIFRKDADFSKMTHSNCFENGTEEIEWNDEKYFNSRDVLIQFQNLDTVFLNQINSNKVIKDGHMISSSDKRVDLTMKSILRKIRRDIRLQFFETTCFDTKIRTNKIETFIDCLNHYSTLVFNGNPTKKQILALGSLIFNKYVQQSLQIQKQIGEIDDLEYRQLSSLCNKIHQVLYKYSESRLNSLASVEEFRQIVTKHWELYGDTEIRSDYKQSYHKILRKFIFLQEDVEKSICYDHHKAYNLL